MGIAPVELAIDYVWLHSDFEYESVGFLASFVLGIAMNDEGLTLELDSTAFEIDNENEENFVAGIEISDMVMNCAN